MRISTQRQFDGYTDLVLRAQERLIRAQNRAADGKRFETVSEDPSRAIRSVSLRSLKSAQAQFGENLTTAKGWLGFSEQTLGDLGDVLKRANELTVSAANSATGQEARTQMAAEISELQRKLVDLGNTKGPNGQYLFSGQQTDVKPFAAAGGTLGFAGDNNPVPVEVGPGQTTVANVDLAPALTDAYARLESIRQNMMDGDTGSLGNARLTEIQNSMKEVNLLRGNTGSALRQLDQVRQQNERRADELTKGISDLEEVDLSEAILEYTKQQTAYQAAMTVTSKGFSLNLMDYLR